MALRHNYCGYPIVDLEDDIGGVFCPLCNECLDIDDDDCFEDYKFW